MKGAILSTAGLVLFFLTIGYFITDPDLAGNVIKTLGEIEYDYGHTPSSALTGELVLFSVRIITPPISNAACTLSIEGQQLSLPYNSTTADYSRYRLFTTSGTYPYNVSCSIPGEITTISESGSVLIQSELPDLEITIQAEDSAEIGQLATLALAVKNQGGVSYSGNLVLNVDYGDLSTTSQTLSMTGQTQVLTLSHAYASKGTYEVEAEIDPLDAISESSESNNIAMHTFNIVNSTETSSLCGTINTSVTLLENVFCGDGIIVGRTGLTLDCDGHRIYGTSSFSGVTGIFSSYPATIKNCNISKYSKGIIANASLSLSNSTISETRTGLTLLASDNSIRYNLFRDNENAVSNTVTNTINYNDFVSNTKNLNATANTDFKRNYHGTTNYNTIIGKISNNSKTVLIDPFLNASVFDATSTEVHINITPPNLSVEITLKEDDFETVVEFDIETDRKAECRHSMNISVFDSMDVFDSTNSLHHVHELAFIDEEKEFTIKLLCRDLYGVMSPLFESEIISVHSVIPSKIIKVEEEIAAFEAKIDLLKEDQRKLAEASANDTKMKQLTLEIKSYEEHIDNAKDYKKKLEELQDTVEDLNDDYLVDYAEDVVQLSSNITSLTEDLNDAIQNDETDVDDILAEYFSYLDQMYQRLLANETKSEEKEDVLRSYLLVRVAREKRDLEIKRDRYVGINNLNPSVNYSNQISSFDLLIADKDKEISDLTYQEKLLDLESEEELLERMKILYDSYYEQLSFLIDTTEDRISFARSGHHDELQLDLEVLLADLEKERDDVKVSQDALEDDIKVKRQEILDLKQNKTITVELYDAVINVAISPEAANSTIQAPLAVENVLLTKIVATVGNVPEESYLEISLYKSKPYVDTDAIKALQWYFLNATPGLEITSLSITFALDDSLLQEYKLMPEDVTGLIYQEGVQAAATELSSTTPPGESSLGLAELTDIIDQNTNSSTYQVNLTRLGNFGIGYHVYAADSESQPACEPDWQCGDFTSCGENSTMIRDCADINGCDPEQLTKTEEQGCSLPTCSDGLHNGNEEGVDCGGSCEGACLIEEIPSPVPDQPEKPKRNWVSYLFIFLTVVILGGIVASKVVLMRHTKQDHPVYYSILNYITEQLFYYADEGKVRDELAKKGFSLDEIAYYLRLAKYVLHRLETTKTLEPIIKELESQGWDQATAERIVSHIAVMNVKCQMKEFGNLSENESDHSIVKEMFRMEGYDEKIIDKALEREHDNTRH